MDLISFFSKEKNSGLRKELHVSNGISVSSFEEKGEGIDFYEIGGTIFLIIKW